MNEEERPSLGTEVSLIPVVNYDGPHGPPGGTKATLGDLIAWWESDSYREFVKLYPWINTVSIITDDEDLMG